MKTGWTSLGSAARVPPRPWRVVPRLDFLFPLLSSLSLSLSLSLENGETVLFVGQRRRKKRRVGSSFSFLSIYIYIFDEAGKEVSHRARHNLKSCSSNFRCGVSAERREDGVRITLRGLARPCTTHNPLKVYADSGTS